MRGRSQTGASNGNWVKRDAKTGRFMDQKVDGKPFKGVTKEKQYGRQGGVSSCARLFWLA